MRSIINFIRYNRYIKKAVKEEKLIDKLRFLFGGREFNTDWVGRIYTVINPVIDDVGSGGNTIIYDDDRKPLIEKWLMDNLNILSKFVATNNLFDLMTYKINKIDEDYNYLVVLQNVYFDSFKRALKIWSTILGVSLIIGLSLLIIL